MFDYRIRTIPIVTDTVGGRTLVGVVTRRDLMPALKRWRTPGMAECEFQNAKQS